MTHSPKIAKNVLYLSTMIFYFLVALVFIGVLWLAVTLGRAALGAWKLKREKREKAINAASFISRLNDEPGGNPDNPIPIQTPSVVEAAASDYTCPFCDTGMAVWAHRALEHHGRRLRLAELKCKRCCFSRDVYFELKQMN